MELFRADAGGTDDTAAVRYMYYVLTHAIISNVQISGGAGDIPIETVSFNYGLIYWKYDPQDRETGEGSEPIGTGWDLKSNKQPDAEP